MLAYSEPLELLEFSWPLFTLNHFAPFELCLMRLVHRTVCRGTQQVGGPVGFSAGLQCILQQLEHIIGWEIGATSTATLGIPLSI